MTAHVKSLGFYKHGTRQPLARAKANLKYIEANHERHQNNPDLFTKDQDHVSRKEFYDRLQEQPERGVVAHKLVLTVSQDERERLSLDMKELVRETMNRFEMRNGQSLDWVAAIHDDKNHPHAHIMIRGYDNDGKQVGIFPRHIKDFQEIAEQEKNRQVERHQEHSRDRDHGKDRGRDLFKEIEHELRQDFEARRSQDKSRDRGHDRSHRQEQEQRLQRPAERPLERPSLRAKIPDFRGLGNPANEMTESRIRKRRNRNKQQQQRQERQSPSLER